MKNLLKVVALAAVVLAALTACNPTKDPGKSGSHKVVTVFTDGDHNIGVLKSLKTIKAIGPASNCSWTLMYDLSGGKTVVIEKGGATSARKGVKLGGTRKITYRDPKTHKLVTKKDRPSSFYSENCKTWVEK